MAIEKTYFTDYDLTKIYAWFTANATEYFDSIDISEDKLKITCYVGELDAFTITSTAETKGTLKFTFKAENGYSVTATPKGETIGTNIHIRRLTKTNSGIAIAVEGYVQGHASYSGGTISARDGIFITKDNSGNLAFVWASLLMTGSKFLNVTYNEHENLYCMNVKSAAVSSAAGANSETSFGFTQKDYVQLVPIGLDNQNACHLPDCCFSYYSNVLGTECRLVQGETKYVYNGYIALKD